jgi:hypothetical protein
MPITAAVPANLMPKAAATARQAMQPASGEPRSWQRDDLYD